MAHASPILNQDGFRGRNDDGSESAATWKAALNTDWTQAVDENFRIRFLVTETGGAASNNVQPQLQYNLNSAGWNDVNATSLVARSSLSPNFAEGDNTTQQLGAGTFITPNSGMDEDEGLAGEANNIDFAGNDEVEVEFCLQIRGADVVDSDTLQFRVTNAGTLLDNYNQTPTVTVSEGAVFDESATISADGTLASVADAVFEPAATLAADGTIAAEADAGMEPGASLAAAGQLAAGADALMDDGAAAAADAQLSAAGGLDFQESAAIAAAGQLASVVDVEFAPSAELAAGGELAAAVDVAFDPSADIAADGKLSAAAGLVAEPGIALLAGAILTAVAEVIGAASDAQGTLSLSGVHCTPLLASVLSVGAAIQAATNVNPALAGTARIRTAP
ncbi:MAG: hypothetical protein IIA40_10120 [SAR324 cluster bacterium]|nr:hypothetical protein [SAR324 cluster bacterium]